LPKPLLLEKSPVTFDKTSAILLGFDEPKELILVDFLRRVDDEETKQPLWISQFLESLDFTLRGSLYDQQITTFRHKTGRILRPIIASVSKSRDGSYCECHAVFVDAFTAPPETQQNPLQLLADGVRLAARVRIEVLNKYLDRMGVLYRTKITESGEEDSLSTKFPIRSCLVEAMELIIQEGQMHNLNWKDDPPRLFDRDGEQREYETIRHQFQHLYPELKKTARKEDEQAEPDYKSTNEICAQDR
jgi:hypothetical protein